jgi:hypothetical protein
MVVAKKEKGLLRLQQLAVVEEVVEGKESRTNL